MKKDIYELANKAHQLNMIRCELFEEGKENIIKNNIKNNNLIENLFDTYLDITTIPKAEKTYLELCKYYEKIDKEAADFYYNCYLETLDKKDVKIKQKTRLP